MGILNENGEGDEEREYAYTGGKEGTVIDYVIVGEDVRKRLNRLEVGKQIDSDHQAVTVHVQVKSSRSYKKGNGIRRTEKIWDWSEKGKRNSRRRQRSWSWRRKGWRRR